MGLRRNDGRLFGGCLARGFFRGLFGGFLGGFFGRALFGGGFLRRLLGGSLFGGLLCRLLGRATAFALGRGGDQLPAFLVGQRFGLAVLGHLGVLVAVGDVRAVA